MNLSLHFTLEELTVTSQPYQNIPSTRNVDALTALCVNVLEPLRAVVGPLRVTSGFRSPAVNAAVGGSSSSQHLKGQAADVKPLSMSIEDAWNHVVLMVGAGELPVDQGIVYQKTAGHGWLHLSYDTERPQRRQLLVQLAGGVFESWAHFQAEKRPLVLA